MEIIGDLGEEHNICKALGVKLGTFIREKEVVITFIKKIFLHF